MDEMKSSEFRKRYAGLTEPVFVTVNGHRIGFYQPMAPGSWVHLEGREPLTDALGEVSEMLRTRSFNSRPITPVPKRGR